MKVKGIPPMELRVFLRRESTFLILIQLYSKKARVKKRGHRTSENSENKMDDHPRKTIILLAVQTWLVILSVKNSKGHQGIPIDSSSIAKLLQFLLL